MSRFFCVGETVRVRMGLLGRFLVLFAFFGIAACDGRAVKVIASDESTESETVVATQDVSSNEAVCVDTAPVGDGWGWDGTATCRVGGNSSASNQTDQPVAEPQLNNEPGCIDTAPLGDGWGWNGTESCPIAGASGNNAGNNSPSEVYITDLVLVTGQSNALGAETSYDPSLDAPNDRVFAYTDEGWRVADLNQVWDLGWHPRNDPNTDPSNNFALHFGKRVAQRRPDRVVGFILVTAPGEKIEHWNPNGAFFAQIRDKVSRAISELPVKSRVDAILWHQGESDGEDRDQYSVALYELISAFKSEPWFSDGFPFICGETAESPVNNQLNRLNFDDDPWTSCVEGEGLATERDESHFTAESLRTIGARYADRFLQMFLGG